MNDLANENGCSREEAPKVPSSTVPGGLPVSNYGAQDGEAPARLKISWHVAPAQNVAILDLTGQAGGLGLAPLASAEPVANAGQSRLQKYKGL
jgi:hypothetical protein